MKYFRYHIHITLFFLIIFLISFSGCSNKPKLNKNKLVKIYADLVIAQDSLGINLNAFKNEKKNIFKRHKITEKKYSNILEYYKENPEEWKDFFKDVITYLKQKEKKQNSI